MPDPRRVAFARSVEIQRAAPHIRELADGLRAAGAEAKLFFTDGECGPEDFPGPSEKLPAHTTPDDLVTRIRQWGADAFVSISLRDENAVRDSVVAGRLAAAGVRVVMHDPAVTVLLSNKAETKALLRGAGIPVPDDVLLDGDVLNGRTVALPGYRDHVTEQAHRIGFPLLCKPLWDSFGNGIRYVEGPEALAALLRAPMECHALLERCLDGELCSVEIIGTDGAYRVQPLVWKGRTGGEPSFLFGSVRYAGPRPEAERQFAGLSASLVRLCAEVRLRGAAEVEMIYRNGTYEVIEINPRVSGTTLLSGVASGRNTYAELLHMALGSGPGEESWPTAAVRWAWEFPVAKPTPALLRDAAGMIDVVRAGTLRISGQEYGGTMVASCEFGGEAAFLAALRKLGDSHGFLAPHIEEDIARALARQAP